MRYITILYILVLLNSSCFNKLYQEKSIITQTNYRNVSIRIEVDGFKDSVSNLRNILVQLINDSLELVYFEDPRCVGVVQFRLLSDKKKEIPPKFIYKPDVACKEGLLIVDAKSTKKVIYPYPLGELYSLTTGRKYILECKYYGIIKDKTSIIFKDQEIVLIDEVEINN